MCGKPFSGEITCSVMLLRVYLYTGIMLNVKICICLNITEFYLIIDRHNKNRCSEVTAYSQSM